MGIPIKGPLHDIRVPTGLSSGKGESQGANCPTSGNNKEACLTKPLLSGRVWGREDMKYLSKNL